MDAKQRVAALVNNEKRKVDATNAAKWLYENIKKGAIKFVKNRAVS